MIDWISAFLTRNRFIHSQGNYDNFSHSTPLTKKYFKKLARVTEVDYEWIENKKQLTISILYPVFHYPVELGLVD